MRRGPHPSLPQHRRCAARPPREGRRSDRLSVTRTAHARASETPPRAQRRRAVRLLGSRRGTVDASARSSSQPRPSRCGARAVLAADKTAVARHEPLHQEAVFARRCRARGGRGRRQSHVAHGDCCYRRPVSLHDLQWYRRAAAPGWLRLVDDVAAAAAGSGITGCACVDRLDQRVDAVGGQRARRGRSGAEWSDAVECARCSSRSALQTLQPVAPA